MNLSYSVLEKMGYRRRSADESISAAFSSITVISTSGISVSDEKAFKTHGTVAGHRYSVSLAKSVNKACHALVGNGYCEDEPAWLEQNKVLPPFALVLVGPTAVHEMTGEFIQEAEGKLLSYDGFPAAMQELRGLEEQVLPAVLSSLGCSFNGPDRPVSLRAVDRESFGKTLKGEFILDRKVTMTATAVVARAVTDHDADACLQQVGQLASSMNPKVSKFFNLGLQESDPLKRFLYLFLTIERQTHFAFATASGMSSVASVVNSPRRVQVAANDFFVRHVGRFTNLRDRFIWCVMSVWTDFDDADVATFERVKKVRDQIAHGELAVPPASIFVDVEQLAIKLQLTHL